MSKLARSVRQAASKHVLLLLLHQTLASQHGDINICLCATPRRTKQGISKCCSTVGLCARLASSSSPCLRKRWPWRWQQNGLHRCCTEQRTSLHHAWGACMQPLIVMLPAQNAMLLCAGQQPAKAAHHASHEPGSDRA
jgi:hypothetical protein